MTDQKLPSRGRVKRVALAAVVGAHGVKGELRLKLFSDSIESLARYSHLYVGERELKLRDIREGGKTAIARFEGIADRAAAEALRGAVIEIDRDKLPPLEEGEYYHADLIGLPCLDERGEPLGTVVAVENFGAGDVIEIERPRGARFMIPVSASVIELDRLVVESAFVP